MCWPSRTTSAQPLLSIWGWARGQTPPQEPVSPALLTSEDGVCGVEAVVVREQPLLSPPLTKNKPHGVSAPHPVDRG